MSPTRRSFVKAMVVMPAIALLPTFTPAPRTLAVEAPAPFMSRGFVLVSTGDEDAGGAPNGMFVSNCETNGTRTETPFIQAGKRRYISESEFERLIGLHDQIFAAVSTAPSSIDPAAAIELPLIDEHPNSERIGQIHALSTLSASCIHRLDASAMVDHIVDQNLDPEAFRRVFAWFDAAKEVLTTAGYLPHN